MQHVRIKLLFMDVDGTLTDGRLHISPAGECFKSFHVKDGYGIRHILPRYGITPVIITGRSSKIVSYRAEELGIQAVYQNIADKAGCVREIAAAFQLSAAEMAYIGDDLNDLPAMELCGVRGCPADAVSAVKEICGYVCVNPGGGGAVREFIDWLCFARSDAALRDQS